VRFLFPLLVILLTIFAIAPLGYPGGFQSHTGLLAAYNLIDLDRNPLHLFDWAPIVGRPLDFLRGDGALPYWLAMLLHRVGIGYLDAIKLVYAFAWIAGALAMFALVRKLVVSTFTSLTLRVNSAEPFFGDAGGLLAATVYTYLPFHIATVYVRGAFAEAFAWALFPIAILAVVSQQSTVNSQGDRRQTTDNRFFIIRNSQFASFAFCLFTFALLFLTQPGLAILFTLFAAAILYALNGRARANLRALFAACTGIALGALIALPVIARYGWQFSRDNFGTAYVQPFQLFSALWGYGAPAGNFLDQFPYQLGVVPLSLGIITAALAARAPALANGVRRAAFIFLGAAVVVALMTFEIAAPLWRVLGIFAAPYQLLALVGFVLACAAGAFVKIDARFARFPMLAALVALPVVASYAYLAPRFVEANPTRHVIAIFGSNEIALLDYKLYGPLQRGATARLELTWQALREVDRDYTIFVHAVHADGNKYGERDGKPRDGELPTLKWSPGQVVLDTQTVQIDVEGPREGYHLEFGLYNAATGQRALTRDGTDHLVLPRPGDPPPIIRTR